MTADWDRSTISSQILKSSSILPPTTGEQDVLTTGTLPEFVLYPTPSVYLTGSFLCLDFETTNHNKGTARDKSNRVVLARWCVDGGEYRSLRDDGLEKLFEDLDACDFLLAHNAKFELQWLRRLGYDGDLVVYDTMLGEYVWGSNRKVALGLDDLARKYLGSYEDHPVSALITGGVCPSTIPYDELDEYCTKDVRLTVDIFLLQVQVLAELGLLPVLYTRCLFTPVLAAIELEGMALDRELVREWYTKFNQELNELKAKIATFTGGVNPGSPKQMGVYLYETLGFEELVDRSGNPIRTAAGNRCTDIDTIVVLRCTNDRQREFVELYKDFGSLKVNTNSLGKMFKCCEDTPDDQVPILYATFNQAVTKTGRLSSSGSEYRLQFQNFNRDFKPLFTRRSAKFLVGEADASQLEFRVAAHLGRDGRAVSDIRDAGFDVHFQTAETILARDRSKISKEERNLVKPKTFRPLYGGMAGTKAERAYYKFFQDKYRGIYQAQTGWTQAVSRAKQLTTETGQIFYWPNCKVQADGYITERTSIFNFPVQSLATADIIPVSVVCIYYRLRSIQAQTFLVNTVHDSIIAEVEQSEERVFRDICNRSLTADAMVYLYRCYGITFTCPLGVESKIGTHWGKGTEEKYNLDDRELPELVKV